MRRTFEHEHGTATAAAGAKTKDALNDYLKTQRWCRWYAGICTVIAGVLGGVATAKIDQAPDPWPGWWVVILPAMSVVLAVALVIPGTIVAENAVRRQRTGASPGIPDARGPVAKPAEGLTNKTHPLPDTQKVTVTRPPGHALASAQVLTGPGVASAEDALANATQRREPARAPADAQVPAGLGGVATGPQRRVAE